MSQNYDENIRNNFIGMFRRDAEINISRRNALNNYPVNEMMNFFKNDFGRWVLSSKKRGLNEYVDNEYKPVIPTLADHILLSTILKAFQLSNTKDKMQKIAIKLPLESYCFSLFIGFLCLIHHGLEASISDLSINAKFKPGGGVLLISDNNDLGIRLLGTRYSGLELTKVYPTYKLKSNGDFQKWCNIQPKVPSLPWFGFFRAYFDSLPEKCSLNPNITIIDLMPFKHRNKLDKLINWAENIAKSNLLFVLSPLGDNEIDKALEQYEFNIIPIDSYFIEEVTNNFTANNNKEATNKTHCWSINELNNPYKDFHISVIKDCKDIERLVIRILELIESAEHKVEGLPRPFHRLKTITFDLLNMVVPLYWYERERELQKKPTLMSLIERASNSVPLTEHEKIVFNNTLPAAVHEIIALYQLIEGMENTPKGICLKNSLVNANTNINKKYTILVGDNVTKSLLPQWLRQALYKERELLRRITISTLNEYHQEKISDIDIELENKSIINIGCWQRKYYDLLWDDKTEEILFITFEMEAEIVRKQINAQYSVIEKALNERVSAFNYIFGCNSVKSCTMEDKPIPKIDMVEHMLNITTPGIYVEQYQYGDSEIKLDIDTLINLMKETFEQHNNDYGIEEFEERLDDSSIEDQIQYYGAITRNTAFRCIKLLTKDKSLIFLERYDDYKIFNADKQKLYDLPAIQIYPGNYLVRHRSGVRKDIFNFLLESVSKTPVMLYINSCLNQWYEMLQKLKSKHIEGFGRNNGIYNRMLADLKSNGCNIKRPETVRNWVRGSSKIIARENLIAVAISIEDEEALKKCDHISSAMRKLFGIHIELGKVLSKVLYKHVTKAVDGDIIESSEVVEIQGGIKIPLSDIIDAVEIVEIESVNKSIDYSVPYWLLGKSINEAQYLKLIEQNIIKIVKEEDNG